MDVENIISHFNIKGSVRKAIPFGSGHINNTFRVFNNDKECPDYLLQSINHHVFQDVPAMMDNIQKVTEHMKNKLHVRINYEVITLVPTNEGSLFYKDGKGNYWRVYIFMKGLKTFDLAETSGQIYEGAKAFGTFLRLLADFPANSLHVTIPDFHNVLARLDTFKKIVNANAKNRRITEVGKEVKYILSMAGEMGTIQKLGMQEKIPVRVTHNDTKFNNVLLDHNNKGRCVIDLDTVMPGYVHYDFGDGIRTTANVAPEDEPDLGKVDIDLSRFEAFATGYLEATRDTLTATELKYLARSGALLSYLMGVRFLTDYLQRDVYYKTSFKGHNLQRAKSQLALAGKIMEKLPDMEGIVKRA